MTPQRWSEQPDDPAYDAAERSARQLVRGVPVPRGLSAREREALLVEIGEACQPAARRWRGWPALGAALAVGLVLVALAYRPGGPGGQEPGGPRAAPQALTVAAGQTLRLALGPPGLQAELELSGPAEALLEPAGDGFQLTRGRAVVRTHQAPISLRAGAERTVLQARAHSHLEIEALSLELKVICYAGSAALDGTGGLLVVREQSELLIPLDGGPPRLRPRASAAPEAPGRRGRPDALAASAPAASAPAASAPPAPLRDAAPAGGSEAGRAAAAPAQVRSGRGRRDTAAAVIQPPSTPTSAVPTTPLPALPAAGPSSLAEEADLLARAVKQLHGRRQPARALQLLEEYEKRFPAGSLALEVRLARIEALLLLGRRSTALQLLDAVTLDGRRTLARTAELRTVRAELRAAAGRCTEAEADFTAVLEPAGGVPQSTLIERALYGRASCRAGRHDTAGARADLTSYLARFPRGSQASNARRALGLPR